MSSTDLYIPPPKLQFRLLGYSSHSVLYTNSSSESIGQVSVTQAANDNQWFTLIPGTAVVDAGHYVIKSVANGRVLYSRRVKDPKVGASAGSGPTLPEHWFKLLPGSGQYSKYFRIWTVWEDMILVSRTDQSPNLYNITGTLQTNANEYFMYLWEDMKVTKVDYDLDSARVLTSKPVTIGEQTLDNSGSTQDQTTSFAVEQEVKKTSSFEYSTGFTVSTGMSFTAGVPFITKGRFEVNLQDSHEWTWGESNEYTSKIIATFPLKAGPGEVVEGTAVVNQGTLEVPYTMTLVGKKSGVEVTTKGKWTGVSTWDIRYTPKTVKPAAA